VRRPSTRGKGTRHTPTINNTIDTKATPDEVWAVLADMPATRQWLPGVVADRMDGNVRICKMADGQQVHERISDISAEQRSFRFEHVRLPLPVQRSRGTFTVTAGSDPHTATVTVRTTFEPLDQTGVDKLRGIVHGAFQQSLESLRRFVEDDIPWDAT
jgi:uncharacterized protein YndB with AHSA1/START domain